jgi:trk system potassium uptake protein TrkA
MKYCIIGLGQFGEALARELAASGQEVIAIDHDAAAVARLQDVVTIAAEVDATDLEGLREVGAGDCDVGIVAIGDNFENSLVSTAHLKELDLSQVLCRVLGPVHERLLDLMGITEKIEAESIAARQLAKRLGIRRALRHFNISENYAIIEMEVPKELVGKGLAEAGLRGKYQVNLITLRRIADPDQPDETQILGVPEPNTRFQSGDHLILFGREEDLKRFSEKH